MSVSTPKNDRIETAMALPDENVQDYPRPPALEPVPQRIVVRFGGEVIAEATGAYRVLETHHAPTYYLPPDSVTATLRPARGGSLCEWKGQAAYFDVIAGGRTASRAAWCYPRPTKAFEAITGYLALYASLMDACEIDGVPAVPQPGSFYGGWVTPNLKGIPKGAPGTEYW